VELIWPFEYFTREELQCKCGCGGLPEEDFIYKVEKLREKARFPFPVSSGYRCSDYNDRVSSTGRNGPHTTGRAIDILVNRGQAYTLLVLALPEFTGIGVSQKGQGRFVHLDDLPNKEGQPRPTIWSY
jgi:zinc D-Ala-D-Ala carboxypeptidase